MGGQAGKSHGEGGGGDVAINKNAQVVGGMNVGGAADRQTDRPADLRTDKSANRQACRPVANVYFVLCYFLEPKSCGVNEASVNQLKDHSSFTSTRKEEANLSNLRNTATVLCNMQLISVMIGLI